MNQATKLPLKPTLEDVLREFEIWRAVKKKRSRIPEQLWEAAVKLSSNYTPHQISRALHLDYVELKNRISSSMHDKVLSEHGNTASFIEVDFSKSISTSECSVEVEKSDGSKMKMSFKGGIGLDLMEFGKLFLENQP